MRSQLMESSAGPRAGVIDAMEAKQRAEADLAEQIGQADEAAAALAVATSEGEKAIKTFIAENVEKQTEAERQIDEKEQQLIRAQKKLDAMTIKKPDQRDGADICHYDRRPGGHGWIRVDAGRAGKCSAGDRGLLAQPGHRLRRSGSASGDQGSGLSVHALRGD